MLLVSNGKVTGESEYIEYALIRADNYGWLNGINDDEHRPVRDCNYNWGTFTEDMKGATVEIRMNRQGNTASVRADVTTVSGAKYWYVCELSNLPDSGIIGTYLSVERAYLEIDTEASYVKITKSLIYE